jgi:hypothetical protein
MVNTTPLPALSQAHMQLTAAKTAQRAKGLWFIGSPPGGYNTTAQEESQRKNKEKIQKFLLTPAISCDKIPK